MLFEFISLALFQVQSLKKTFRRLDLNSICGFNLKERGSPHCFLRLRPHQLVRLVLTHPPHVGVYDSFALINTTLARKLLPTVYECLCLSLSPEVTQLYLNAYIMFSPVFAHLYVYTFDCK